MLRDRKISVREKINSLGPWIEDRLDRGCSRKQITKRLPITQWLPKYSLEDGTGDLVAGVTVGMTVVLQAIAYSNIAGLDPQVGIIKKKKKIYEEDKKSVWLRSARLVISRAPVQIPANAVLSR